MCVFSDKLGLAFSAIAGKQLVKLAIRRAEREAAKSLWQFNWPLSLRTCPRAEQSGLRVVAVTGIVGL